MGDPELKTIKLLGGAEVVVDFSQRQTPCRRCKKMIRFGITKNSKYIPIIEKGEDWQTHFVDCEFADEFRKKKVIDAQLDEMDKEREKLNLEE